MNYNIYEVMAIIFFVLAGLAVVGTLVYFLKYHIAHVIAVLSGRQERKQIAGWRNSMVPGEHITEQLHEHGDNATILLDADERVTCKLNGNSEETTSVLSETREEVTSILCGNSEEATSVLNEENSEEATSVLNEATSVLNEDNRDEGICILDGDNHDNTNVMNTGEEVRLISADYIISLAGKMEKVQK